jgi:hypothetical protein
VVRLLSLFALLGAVTLAVASAGTGSDRATAHTVSATGAVDLTKGLNGDAVLRAGAMEPGRRVTGTVTVANAGGATGAFRVVETDVLDTPGPGGRRLSGRLRMQIDDVRTQRTTYRGVLGRMNGADLGYLRAGEKRTYRFVVTAPAAAGARDYAGSRVETTFDFTARTAEPPARPPERDTAPPTVVVQSAPAQRAASGRLAISLTCAERCTIAGVSRGTPVGPRKLLPGRPALLAVRLSPAEAHALEGLLQRRGRAALPLAVTVADPAGNRATAAVMVTAAR